MTNFSRSESLGAGGQAILEYAILIGVVTGAIVAMQLYAKRGIQAGVKLMADQIGDQAEGIRYESGERQNKVAAEGRTLERLTAAATDTNQGQQVKLEHGGKRTTVILGDETSVTGALPGEPSGLVSSARVVVDVR